MKDRDIMLDVPASEGTLIEGRKVVVVVGIDLYHAWPTLDNAVSDAKGALAIFQRLGFDQIIAPLIDEKATADAIRRLVTDDLATLRSDDSLVLFFAGHGHTQTRMLQSGPLQTGFLIPVDGDHPEGRTANWLRLDTWLSDVARLPARHILVILDACHSGIALGSLIKWRGGVSRRGNSLDELRRRQSRRVITSALGNQRALDGGPISGHSLFTGCLIEGLTGGIVQDGRHEVTGSEIGIYVQQRVTAYTGSRQTPDFGTLELDQRGELIIPITTTERLLQSITDTVGMSLHHLQHIDAPNSQLFDGHRRLLYRSRPLLLIIVGGLLFLIMAAIWYPRKDKQHTTSDPIRIEFGDCAPLKTYFVSGPRPLSDNDSMCDSAFGWGEIGINSNGSQSPSSVSDQNKTETSMQLDPEKMSNRDARTKTMYKMKTQEKDESMSIIGSVTGTDDELPDEASSIVSADGKLSAAMQEFRGLTLRFGTPITSDSLSSADKAFIRVPVKSQTRAFLSCYSDLSWSGLKIASVTINLLITSEGRVIDVKSSGVNSKLSACVANIFRQLEFSKRSDGISIKVEYPLVFKVDFSAEAAIVKSVKQNPLVNSQDAFRVCLRAHPKHYGVLVMDLDINKKMGKITTARIQGDVGEAQATCLSNALRSTIVMDHQGSRRCSVAFGTMPPVSLPAVDITSDSISWNGAVLMPDSIVGAFESYRAKYINDNDSFHDARTDNAVLAQAVSLYGPVAVRPRNTVRMKRVEPVLFAIRAASVPFVLLAEDDQTWKLLREIQLPVVPVPDGRGDDWRQIKTKAEHRCIKGSEEEATLSLLIAEGRIWVGISRLNELQEIKNKGHNRDWETLHTALIEERIIKIRSEIEIAADDDVPYGEVVKVVEFVKSIGSFEWVLTGRNDLATLPP